MSDDMLISAAREIADRYRLEEVHAAAQAAFERHRLSAPTPDEIELLHAVLDDAIDELRRLANDNGPRLRSLAGPPHGDDDPPRPEWQELCVHAALRCDADAEWQAMSADDRAADAADRALVETAGIIPTSEDRWARFDSATLLDAIPRLTAMKADIVSRFTTPDEDGRTVDVPLWRLDEDDARAFLFKLANSKLLDA